MAVERLRRGERRPLCGRCGPPRAAPYTPHAAACNPRAQFLNSAALNSDDSIVRVYSFVLGSILTLAAFPTYAADTRTGALAAKIIFKADTRTGSFNGASGGTVPGEGTGVQALRLFEPSETNTQIAAAKTKWIKRVELGVSGSANTGALYPNCAKFTHPSEASVMCNTTTPCAGPASYFRVSEKDCYVLSGTGCSNGTADPTGAVCKGTGKATDGIYVRVQFDRTTTLLEADENILAVLEYQASSLKRDPASPASCYTALGLFDATRAECTDQVWQIFLRANLTADYSPFMMVVPPSQGWMDTTTDPDTMGGPRTTKQFILPIASDPALQYLQISRIRANNSDSLMSNCSSNSPLCLGMVLYSLTLFRI